MANRRFPSSLERENSVSSKRMIVLIGPSRMLAPFQRAKLLVKQQVERERLQLVAARWRGLLHWCDESTREWAGQNGQGSSWEYRFLVIVKISFAPRHQRTQTLMGGAS